MVVTSKLLSSDPVITMAPGRINMSLIHARTTPPHINGYRDMKFGGVFSISGTTKVIGSPDTPFSCLAVLFDERSKKAVRSKYSTPSGNYIFTNIANGPWFVVAFDHTNAYGAVVSSNQFGVS